MLFIYKYLKKAKTTGFGDFFLIFFAYYILFTRIYYYVYYFRLEVMLYV